jgi:hypothetical protein
MSPRTFDIKTGAVLGGPPPRPLDELKVQVRDAAVYVQYRDFRLGGLTLETGTDKFPHSQYGVQNDKSLTRGVDVD